MITLLSYWSRLDETGFKKKMHIVHRLMMAQEQLSRPVLSGNGKWCPQEITIDGLYKIFLREIFLRDQIFQSNCFSFDNIFGALTVTTFQESSKSWSNTDLTSSMKHIIKMYET